MNSEQRAADSETRNESPHLEGLQNRLQDYEALKFKIAGLIREADSAAWTAKREQLQREFQILLKRLAEDRFYLTLAGQFSRGKTTLMNAMLGMDRLPTGIIPITSVITAVSYGTRERVVIHFENSSLTHEIPLSELPGWITEQGNPGNKRKIEMAEVQIPAELLRRGAFFIDTPGLGSAIIENTDTTNRFLPYIDALVLVTSFEFPLSQEEIVFVRRIRGRHRKIFIVINKQDLCTPQQRDEVRQFIQLRIAEEADGDDIPLHSISASEALSAKLKRDPAQLERSGLATFEQALINYLLKDRARDFLTATCDRLELLLENDDVPALKHLGNRLEEIRARVQGQQHPENDSTHTGTAAIEVKSGRSLKISSCFVCKQMADASFKFMSQFQYALSHSREQQLLHASNSGFCTLHSREYARLASPQGIASGYPNTLLFVAKGLRTLSYEGRLRDDWKEQLEQLLPDSHKCSACQTVAQTEAALIETFVSEHRGIRSEDEIDLPCVCLRHLEAILQKAPDTELANRMVSNSAAVLERTAENMERFALRHGGLHMELVTKEELESPEKALNLLVGQPNVRPIGSR